MFGERSMLLDATAQGRDSALAASTPPSTTSRLRLIEKEQILKIRDSSQNSKINI